MDRNSIARSGSSASVYSVKEIFRFPNAWLCNGTDPVAADRFTSGAFLKRLLDVAFAFATDSGIFVLGEVGI